MYASDEVVPEQLEDGPPGTRFNILLVSVPLTSGRTPEGIVTIIAAKLAAIMSEPPNLVLGGIAPFYKHWYSFRKTYSSSWTFTVDQIVDPVGTAAVLGALYREFPNCKAEYIQ